MLYICWTSTLFSDDVGTHSFQNWSVIKWIRLANLCNALSAPVATCPSPHCETPHLHDVATSPNTSECCNLPHGSALNRFGDGISGISRISLLRFSLSSDSKPERIIQPEYTWTKSPRYIFCACPSSHCLLQTKCFNHLGSQLLLHPATGITSTYSSFVQLSGHCIRGSVHLHVVDMHLPKRPPNPEQRRTLVFPKDRDGGPCGLWMR